MTQRFDDVMDSIEEATIKWLKANNPGKIEKHIFDMLDKKQTEIVSKLLGFDASYSNIYKLDHCNGRAGESAAGAYLQKVQEVAVNKWLNTIKLPTITDSMLKSLQTDYIQKLKRNVHTQLETQINTHAASIATALIEDVTKEFDVTDRIKLRNLLNGENDED